MVCVALADCGNCERRVFGRAGRISAISADRVFFSFFLVSIHRNRRGSVHIAHKNSSVLYTLPIDFFCFRVIIRYQNKDGINHETDQIKTPTTS